MVFLALAGIACGFLWGRHSPTGSITGPAGSNDHLRVIEGSSECRPGPWGRIRYYPINLAYPGDRIQIVLPADPPPDWFVGASNVAQVETLLTAAGLTADEAARLKATATSSVEATGFWVKPDLAWRTGLAPARRARLYETLERWSQNVEIAQPVRFTRDYPLPQLASRALPPEAAAAFNQMVFSDCNLLCFADSAIVLSHLATAEQAKRFIQLLTGITALMPNLLVDSHDDVEALVAYWGAGGRETDVRALIESSSASGGQRAIPISMLMPPFPRTRVFRYRHESDGPTPNCHYSALNYFAIQPDQSLQDLPTAAQRLIEQYDDIPRADIRPGDLVLIRDDHGDVLHSCNYLCDDLVFTKNGGAMAQPWTIQHMDDVVNSFSCHRKVTVSYAHLRRSFLPLDN